jgi:CelD/BcsL family acetyltransferase involved in cellulose biosynthesis
MRPKASPTPVQLEVEELETLQDEWTPLALRSRNVFATYEWASTWWRHFGGGHRPLVTTCRAGDGTLIGILPFYQWSSSPLRILRFIGHGAGDQLGPIHAPEDLPSVARATQQALARMRWKIFVADNLPGDPSWTAALGGKILARDGSPLLRNPDGGWSAFLARRSSNFRQQVGRRERNLARHHDVTFRLVQDPEALPAALDALFHLHSLRWSNGSSGFIPRAAFHREFAATALDRGWLRLWLLDLDGQTVAAWYGLRFADAECYYQAGRDPDWDHRSVGFVLLVHSIRQAFEDGVAEYRFLHGRDAYKYRFADEDAGVETIALTRGVVARTALSAASFAYPYVKSRIGRLRWKLV